MLPDASQFKIDRLCINYKKKKEDKTENTNSINVGPF